MYALIRMAIHILTTGVHTIVYSGSAHLVGMMLRRIDDARSRWAQEVIEEYKRALELELQHSRSLAYAGGAWERRPSRGTLIGDEASGADPGMLIQTEDRTWDLPAFYIDSKMTVEENEDRLREHLELYASDLPEGPKEYMIEEFVKHAFPMALQMSFEKQLENIDPEDFREED